MALKPVTVSQLNQYISRVIETDPLLGNVNVKGEISNLKYHSSGHVYFSISDSESKINCFLPSSYAKDLEYELGDGLEVVINGFVNIYKKGGYYTLFVKSIQVSGEGNLAMAFQLMKEKLDKEGLFDRAHKKKIPEFPKKIGIITASTGAAVHDIIEIIQQRNSYVDIFVFSAKVQGEGAAQDIADAIEYVNASEEYHDIDTLIVGRGGGSSEDLWAFNEEILARAIFDSEIPIISAVGHEIDFTISDLVADLRAETPTAAAKLAVPDIEELKRRLLNMRSDLLGHLKNKVKYDELKSSNLLYSLKENMNSLLLHHSNRLENLKTILIENSPVSILEKGYAVIEDESGKTVTSSQFVNGTYTARFKDGNVRFKADIIE